MIIELDHSENVKSMEEGTGSQDHLWTSTCWPSLRATGLSHVSKSTQSHSISNKDSVISWGFGAILNQYTEGAKMYHRVSQISSGGISTNMVPA